MKPQRLLYLTAHKMVAYRWQSGVLTSEEQFPVSETGFRQFAAYLAKNAQSVFSLLANVVEEGFHIEAIPFLRGKDRKTVIERKLGQIFFNAALTASLSLGHEKNRRKNERLLLTALSNTSFFAPWLEAIRSTGAALGGIYSLPLLAASLLKKLSLPEEPCLLLSVQDQSLRQSYFEKGELHFSRLTPLHQSSIGGIAQTFSAESLKLQQYLTSQRLIERNQPITAHILAHSGALRTIRHSCTDTPTIRYHFLDTDECARKTGLRTPPQDSHAELLFLNLLVTAPPRIQFANDDLRHGYHLDRLRSLLHGAGAVTLIGCLLFSGKQLFDAHTIAQETGALKAEANTARQRYAEIAKTFPPIPADTGTLRHAIDRYLEQEKRSVSPEGLYREISRALQGSPAVEIDGIDWRIGGAEQTGTVAVQGAAARQVPADSESAVVRGTLKLGANASARQMLTVFTQLVDTLKAQPTLQVEVLQRPFDIESGKSLRGAETMPANGKPRTFSLQITRKLGS